MHADDAARSNSRCDTPAVPPRRHRVRIEHPNHVRFLTFSCQDRLPLLRNDAIKGLFVEHVARARVKHGFHLIAWVVMPEHAHLLLWPHLPRSPVPLILRSLKQGFAQEVLARWQRLNAPVLKGLRGSDGRLHYWLPGGGHDRNIFSDDELAEKLDYIHNNPVTRGLARRPEDWKWSSARWYRGMREGALPMDPVEQPR